MTILVFAAIVNLLVCLTTIIGWATGAKPDSADRWNAIWATACLGFGFLFAAAAA